MVVYEIRAHDLKTILSSGIVEDQAINELCEDYGLTYDEIANYILCTVDYNSYVYTDKKTGITKCRYTERILEIRHVGSYVNEYMLR